MLRTLCAPRLNRRRPGLTLMELVVVLVILAALAALVIPRLGFIKDQSDSAASAAGAGDLISNLETYKLTTGSYPLNMDTLLVGGTAIYTKLFEHTAGPSTFGLTQDLAVDTVGVSGESWAQSFGHSFVPVGGNYSIYDHDAASTDPSNSATVQRTFTSATSAKVAIVNASGPTASTLIKAAGYSSGTIPTGVKLVAFGVGPNTASIGATMASAPRHSAQDTATYGRYIALFAVYQNGKAAELKTVVDSFGSTIDSNISSYKKGAPNS